MAPPDSPPQVAAAGSHGQHSDATGARSVNGGNDSNISHMSYIPSAARGNTGEGDAVPLGNQAESQLPVDSGHTPKDAMDNNGDLRNQYGTEEDTDDEEGLDEEEPSLRYKRLGPNNLAAILDRDAASAITVSERFIVLGTHWGKVYILDFEGNEVRSWSLHSATVNCVCVDAQNEYVASASDDGRVIVNGLYVEEKVVADYRRPIKAVALDPRYSKSSRRRFVSGGMSGELIMRESKWRNHKYFVIHSGSGPIGAIKWRGQLVAWANDEGVRIYNSKTEAQVGFIERPLNSPRADLYKAHLQWKDDTTLLVGWGNFVQVVSVSLPAPSSSTFTAAMTMVSASTVSSSTSGDLAEPVQVTTVFRTDFVVCGISLYRDMFLVLSYDTDLLNAGPEAEGLSRVTDHSGESSYTKEASPPELRIINNNLEEVSSDMLTIDGYALYQANDYALVSGVPSCARKSSEDSVKEQSKMTDENTWYILSPKQLILVRPRGLKDHIQWLVDRGMLEECIECIGQTRRGEGDWAAHPEEITPAQYLEIGQMYIRQLVDRENYGEAARMCEHVLSAPGLGDTQTAWEEWAFAFAECHALDVIAPYLPYDRPRLSNTIYEMVLANFLASDTERFYEMVRQWPHSLYDADSVIIAAESQLERVPDDNIKRALAQLYDYCNQPDKSLRYHLELRTPGIVERIKRDNLYGAVKNKVMLLMEYDHYYLMRSSTASADRPKDGEHSVSFLAPSLKTASMAGGVQLLSDNPDAIPPELVVKQLLGKPELLHIYLHALLNKDAHLGSPFADLQVELYAEYNPELLLNFLRVSNYYRLEKAFEICEMRDMVSEMVFLLSRMGDNHRALQLIIGRLGDVHKAIEFAEEQNDPDVWKDLLEYSKDKPGFIVGLLKRCGSDVNPIQLIRSIPPGLTIPGLKPALSRLLRDTRWNLDIAKNCEKIMRADSSALNSTSRRLQYKGVSMSGVDVCVICGQELDDTDQSTSVLSFWCGHSTHDMCLLHPDVIRKTGLSLLSAQRNTPALVSGGDGEDRPIALSRYERQR
ncbi:Vacuolar protein sorting-associated protein 41, partial [Spiromyces aspiralis]